MSTLETNLIQPSTGTTLTVGASGDTVALGTGVLQSNMLYPAFKASSSGNTSVANTTNSKMTFDTEIYDTDSCFDPSSNYRFTPTTAGKYMFFIRLWAATGDDIDYFGTKLYKNGAINSTYDLAYSVNRDYNSVQISSMAEANGSSDYFEAYCYHQEGGTVDVRGAEFSAFRIGT